MNKHNVNEKGGFSLDSLEEWIRGYRGSGGYGGPVIGRRDVSLRYCGPGFDWRLEGILDGYISLYKSSADEKYLDWIEKDLQTIGKVQLKNGSFPNSCFESNPFEGGMPHEPAMLAAACRARRVLEAKGREIPSGLDAALELFVENRLIRELWSRLLRTFNDWLQSGFEFYSPHSVAAVLELLEEYVALSGEGERLGEYVEGGANSILDVQMETGDMAGAIPISNRTDSPVSTHLLARCVAGLMSAYRLTGRDRYRSGAQRAIEFIRNNVHPHGFGFVPLLYTDRPPKLYPLILGEVAATVTALERSGLENRVGADSWQSLTSYQFANGAFPTGIGFGEMRRPRDVPEWRDRMPVLGWGAQVYALLARKGDKTGRYPARRNDEALRGWVRIGKRRVRLQETYDRLDLLEDGSTTVFEWIKAENWARVCKL